MATRKHVIEAHFEVDAEELFALLVTPSAIRGWWGVSRAIVLPESGGTWAAVWGSDEDDPDYVTVASISVYDPPRRLVLSDYRYRAREGPLPFEADFTTEFVVEPLPEGALLRVSQDGFPAGEEGDAFFKGCEVGWKATFDGIRRYIDR